MCWGVRAKWDSVTALPLDPSSGVSGKDGLTLSFQNGDSCMGSPGKVKMNMICDTNEIGINFKLFEIDIHLNSKHPSL